jgi:hypothetical protein
MSAASLGIIRPDGLLADWFIASIPAELSRAILVEVFGRYVRPSSTTREVVMSKAVVLGAAALALSAAGASAQVYVTPDYGYGYAVPAADLAPPVYGYAAPTYAAPGVYAAPVYSAPPVYAAPMYAAPPVYAAPQVYPAPQVTTGYYAAPAVSQPIYDYDAGYYGRGYWGRPYGYGW